MTVLQLDSITSDSLNTLGPEASDRLKTARQSAWASFERLPWPVKTDEEWRRTDPDMIRLDGLELQPEKPALRVGWDDLPPQVIQSGAILTDLKTAIRQFPDLIEEYLYRSGITGGLSKFVELHKALWNHGLFCYVPEGVKIESPFRSWMEINFGGSAVFPHSLIVVESGAEVTLIQEQRPSEECTGAVFSDEMVEIFVKPEAILRYVHVQRWGSSAKEIFTQRALLGENSKFLNVTVGLGGCLTKANVETVLNGRGAHSELLGILFGAGNQHFDFHTLQDHRAEHTFSDLLYKSALKDQAKFIYTGLIRIEKNAQKSNAYQANRNLLLSQGAQADSIPMLEIEANDVRCTHGVAVGPVDEEQLYYLTSRGLPPAKAERLIVEGFFEQVLQRIPLKDFNDHLLDELTNRLAENE